MGDVDLHISSFQKTSQSFLSEILLSLVPVFDFCPVHVQNPTQVGRGGEGCQALGEHAPGAEGCGGLVQEHHSRLFQDLPSQ